MRFTIADHYFEFVPMTGHQKTCSRYGTAVWEVARHRRERMRSEEDGGDFTELTTRTLCSECGVVRLEHSDGESYETTHVDRIGYGSKPQRCAGLWLHPGPLWGRHELDQLGPEAFYVTGSPSRPTTREDVIGQVGWFKTPRGAVRWYAGYGLVSDSRVGRLKKVPSSNEFKSKTAAVKWVAEQHATELAAAAPGQP